MASTLPPGATLVSGQAITANDGRCSLVMQGDGNFVLYENWRGTRIPVWASNTWGNPGARVVMQADGNLVVYAAGSRPLWSSGTWGNPGASLVVQDDGNAVVYAVDRRPLWASRTNRWTRVLSFRAALHGFRFPNTFVNRIIGNLKSEGRCGGMAYAALDYYFAGVPVPAQRRSLFAPNRVPPDGHWLADYIRDRQIHSFLNLSALRYLGWSMQDTLTAATKGEEFPRLRAAIDGGTPVVLGLIKAQTLGDSGQNHQVVAYGYEYHPVARTMKVLIYDNRSVGVEDTLTSDPATPHFVQDQLSDTWRGWFVHDYTRHQPPVFTMSPAADTRVVRFGDTLKLSHVFTGRTLHSHPLNYTHTGTSGQQHVTGFYGADENDLWRVKGPHGTADTHQAGQTVSHNDVVRLEHVLTRRNLHSHSGHPSPITNQQEVTCFGTNGVGDGNDDWRVEVDGGGTWTAGSRVRLVHVLTGQALHSHAGHSHAIWTAGQQEVTAVSTRDDNDWWWLLEVR